MTNAYITLVTKEDYLSGALVVAQALKGLGTTASLAVFVANLADESMALLSEVYDEVIPVAPVVSANDRELALLGRPELDETFTKILLWKQTQYAKVVYLDADVLPVKAIDDLFDLDVAFAASPDSGWPDIFNSGVFFTKPSLSVYEDLVELSSKEGSSFDGADQGLLNEYFTQWHRLPFLYNVTPSAGYQYTPAYLRYKNDIKVLHFIGRSKPWLTRSSNEFAFGSPGYEVLFHMHSSWWAVFNKFYYGDKAASVFEFTSFGGKGEASELKETKLPNAWDREADLEEEEVSLFASPPAIFPWEQRDESVGATRVFGEDHDYLTEDFGKLSTGASSSSKKSAVNARLEEQIETVRRGSTSTADETALKSNRKIKEHYNIDKSESNTWDPHAQLEKISQLPAQLLNKEDKEEK